MKTFRKIPGYPKYIISKDGIVISNKNKKAVTLTQFKQMHNYLLVNLYTEDKPKTVLVHQLVMLTYGTPKPMDGYVITHIDKDKNNNNISNLKWIKRCDVVSGRKRKPVKAIGLDDTIYFRSISDVAKHFHSNNTIIRYKIKNKTIYKGYLLVDLTTS